MKHEFEPSKMLKIKAAARHQVLDCYPMTCAGWLAGCVQNGITFKGKALEKKKQVHATPNNIDTNAMPKFAHRTTNRTVVRLCR